MSKIVRTKQAGDAWGTSVEAAAGQAVEPEFFATVPDDTVADGTPTKLTWTHQSGSALLDLSTPIAPTFIEAGVYAVGVLVSYRDVSQAGRIAAVVLELGGGSTASDGTLSLENDSSGNVTPELPLVFVQPVAAGQEVDVSVYHSVGVPLTFRISNATVVKLA